MPAPALLLVVLLALPGGGGGGEAPGVYQARPGLVLTPDTTKKPALAPDTAQVRPAPVPLAPDEDEKVTRRSALFIGGAIAALTLITLLLYNVRSR